MAEQIWNQWVNDSRRTLERHVYEILHCIGETPEREGLRDTPKRVSKMYLEVFDGYGQDPKEILSTTFNEEDHHELVIVRRHQFYSHCEHHMVPFFGTATVGYIPDGRVVGISKLARLVDCFSHRLQIQERLTSQVADAIWEEIDPMGVMVVIEAEHLCMKMRGVKSPCSDTVTSAVRGVFAKDPKARAEFLTLAGF